MASLRGSSPGCMVLSVTMVSSHLMGWWSFHTLLPLISAELLPGRHPSASSAWSQASSWFPWCRPSHSCRGSSTQPWHGSFTLYRSEQRDHADIKITGMLYFLHIRPMSLLSPAVKESITRGGRHPEVTATGDPPCFAGWLNGGDDEGLRITILP